MATLINVTGLSKLYADIQAVNNLSFSVNEGDVYGFLGQNGAGKSTTIRMLLTLVKPTSGHISIFGQTLSNHRNEVLSQIGAVIEKPDLYRYLSAYENISIFSRLSGKKLKKRELMHQLEKVGLAERAGSKVKTFSQGMKQRLGIAVALVHDPKLIILDEPTNGLDPQGIADMRNLIISLRKDQGKTVIVSSHLLSEIEQMATRMLIIHKGQKIVEGNVSELLDPAKTMVTVAASNNSYALEKIKESSWVNQLTSEKPIGFTLNKKDIPLLTEQLVSMGIGIQSIVPRHSLENYFLSLTNQPAHVEAAAD